MDTTTSSRPQPRAPWNKGKLISQEGAQLRLRESSPRSGLPTIERPGRMRRVRSLETGGAELRFVAVVRTVLSGELKHAREQPRPADVSRSAPTS